MLLSVIISWICLVTGSVLIISSAIGCLKFPDFYTRLHAAGVGDSCGAPLMLIGIAFKYGFTLTAAKIGLLVLFVLITSPTACHALAKSALIASVKPQGDNNERET